MKRHCFLLFVLCLFVSPAVAQSQPIKVGAAELNQGDTVVFLGDSITHQRLYTQYIEDFFITRFPSTPLKFHNAGIGGDKAWDALQRLDRDVLSKDPQLVTILLGMNDGRYQAFDHQIFKTYETDMTELLDRLVESGTTVSPITPTMFDATAARAMLKQRPRDESMLREYNAVLAYFGTWLRGESDRRNMQSIDMFSPLNQLTRLARQDESGFTFIKDAIHPGPAGQLIMAHAWLENLGMQHGVSNIVLVPTAKSGFKARVTGGAVSELTNNGDDVIEFTFTADALPWVTPEDTAVAAKMLKLDHKFSREGFQIHGLSAGKYSLSIDGTQIGEFPHTQLAAHVELQRFPNTPQSQQAAQVVALNKQRNETTINDLRRHWFTFRNLQRTKRELAETENEQAKQGLNEKVAKGEQQMEGFEEKLVQLEQQAERELAAIYEAAQPQPHRYVITKLK
ncbi:SGNH/GDSL hydrolase family protein [Stieleria sp. TO1_6]|uniref:SGNH/GDSL hydrolase family protein n=1 Tax=Stieleria tagensis TaxID=2956795 RepID=UPI00209AEA52|nr:SGNH/GDSL hydrolase family protein [Stieleria tagensis]MCO8123665.1 SGNH/GDSL hydrolase family protein [Stieleria tagensis]